MKLAIKLLRQPPKWFQEPETKPKSKFWISLHYLWLPVFSHGLKNKYCAKLPELYQEKWIYQTKKIFLTRQLEIEKLRISNYILFSSFEPFLGVPSNKVWEPGTKPKSKVLIFDLLCVISPIKIKFCSNIYQISAIPTFERKGRKIKPQNRWKLGFYILTRHSLSVELSVRAKWRTYL